MRIICTVPQTPVVYDSTDGYEPDSATPVWSTDCISAIDGDDYATITDGVLIIDDTSTGEKAKYCRAELFDDSCDPRQDAVYEFSCKALEVETNAPIWSNLGRLVFGCGLSTGDDNTKDFDLRVGVTLDDGVGFWEIDSITGKAKWLDVGGVLQHVDIAQVDSGDSTSAWSQAHTFRIVKDGLFVKMYVDNNTSPSLNFRLTYLADNFLEDEIKMLSTSAPGRSEFELYHFRYAIATTSFPILSTGACAGDTDDDNDVDVDDLLALLAAWGPCTGCDEDLNDDDVVDLSDLIILFSSWGACS